ncbi:hypothetical protein OG864_31975 [Streptomyces sp. NBC_00124]|uniref:hypothetical protein n=1 Tax=Streptomyces sp. NBC_00124 TaxID=2975662 RepID=UPI002255D2D3|nr:hypothetical protein [Streptomyces sp. NBC_00124]MCX5363314.1 hypothetical protein [Streptomyces sp. NBC_00124]
MRLCTPVTATLPLAAAAALLLTPTPAQAAAPAAPTCATPDARTFPLTTRIHGGPDAYEIGGGYATWYLDLTNTTDRTCENIHPVVVLVDKKHALEPDQPQLEFYEGKRPHPVRFETTDEDELVGVFRQGLTVAPGKTRTVKMRLALTSDAVPNEVTANAAVVQRHEDDGDWVGQSNDYRFAVDTDTPPPPSDTADALPDALPDAEEAAELAHTGPSTPARLLAAALLLTSGGTLLLARRR